MKTKITVIALLFMATITYAQFKIFPNGNIAIKTLEFPLSTISIGTKGYSDHYISIEGPQQGIVSIINGGSREWGQGGTFISRIQRPSRFFVGISGSANAPTNQDYNYGRAFGVMGIAGNATSGYNYGVFGRLRGSNYGAAIYGTINENDNGIALKKMFAGFFNGPVVTNGDHSIIGNLLLKGTIKGPILTNAAENGNNVSTQADCQYITDKLSEINIVSYYKNPNDLVSTNAMTTGDTLASVEVLQNAIEMQDLSKRHYALSTEQLEIAFPDIIYTNDDGTKSINYIELIPILVQSINELNMEIKQLKGEKKAIKTVSQYNTTDIKESKTETSSLSQNIPNPFESATSIKVTIPNNSKEVYLMICDMTGKQVKKITIQDRGMLNLSFTADELCAGMYLYSLVIDGKLIDTKRMIITK